MKWKTEKHPLNAKGKFYVDQNNCVCCDNCKLVAPNNFDYDYKSDFGYYVSKQPETPEELEQMRQAIYECPVEAVMDDGEE